MQFTMVPMNLCLPGKPVDVLHTGAWTAKAIGELKKGVLHNIAASHGSGEICAAAAARGDQALGGRFVHATSAPTTRLRARSTPDCPHRRRRWWRTCLRDIASRPIDVAKFGLIFAGAQKNLGPQRRDVVIVRKDLAERADKNLPTRAAIPHAHQGKVAVPHAAHVCGVHSGPGDGMDRGGRRTSPGFRNAMKPRLRCFTMRIENSNGYYRCPVEKASRSLMNVVFRVAGGDEAVEKEFGKQATAAGLIGTPGHRSVGGMRISLYNAVGLDAVEALTRFMREFQRSRG